MVVNLITKAGVLSLVLLVVGASPAFAAGHSVGGRSGGHSYHPSGGSHSISGYTTKNGNYVAPHRATNPDRSKLNNWSTKGNVNPYTGKSGTKNP